MYTRTAASKWLKRLSFRSTAFNRTSETPTSINVPIFSSRCNVKSSSRNNSNDYRDGYLNGFPWVLFSGPAAAIILGINSNPVLAKDAPSKPSSENGIEESDTIGLRKVEDGSVISNLHTSKWRVFTDNARDLFLQGKLEEAERFFVSAIQEAKEGFGERDPHVASAFNNLAELYRVTKTFDKAEPMYLEAINILEESYGSEDIRVGSALHNLGQFYLVQRKLKEAGNCYERALKIKGHVLGYGHVDYADTMYHLGTVLYLLGEEKDSEALIQDSIRILEEGGLGESFLCVRRLRYLAKIYMKSNNLFEAENVQRKVLHIMELSKGWNSLETVNSADGLASTLYANGCLNEAQELFERCLDARKTLLPKDNIQIGANMLHIARVVMQSSKELKATDISKAVIGIDKAKELLSNSIRISRGVLDKISKHGEKKKIHEDGETRRDGRTALLILLQSLDALGHLEITVQEMKVSKEDPSLVQAENVLFECISAYQKFKGSTFETPEVKAEYFSCLKRLSILISDVKTSRQRRMSSQDLQDEISRLEVELSRYRKQKG
ncbi:Nephrocystin-3, partial [Cucurbita argyrosperma subsp. sororia]